MSGKSYQSIRKQYLKYDADLDALFTLDVCIRVCINVAVKV